MTQPKIDGTSKEKIAWLDQNGPAGGLYLNPTDGSFEIFLDDHLSVVLLKDGSWTIIQP